MYHAYNVTWFGIVTVYIVSTDVQNHRHTQTPTHAHTATYTQYRRADFCTGVEWKIVQAKLFHRGASNTFSIDIEGMVMLLCS
jgi:hypothetical protein